jgi:hypothetical protein
MEYLNAPKAAYEPIHNEAARAPNPVNYMTDSLKTTKDIRRY